MSAVSPSVPIVISACALCLTLYQIYATRRHNRLSVTPHLCGCANTSADPGGVTYSYEVSNCGIGPARVKKFQLFHNGKPWATESHDDIHVLMETLFKGRLKYEFRNSYFIGEEEGLRPGDTRLIAKVFFPGLVHTDRNKILEIVGETRVRIEYESFYGEKFIFDSDHGRKISPEPK